MDNIINNSKKMMKSYNMSKNKISPGGLLIINLLTMNMIKYTFNLSG